MKTKNDLLTMKAFTKPVTIEGKTYYDCPSRMFSIIRLPSLIRELYPQFKRNRAVYNIVCSPSKDELIAYINENDGVPLLIELFERPEG